MWPLLLGWWVFCGCFFLSQTRFYIMREPTIADVGMDIVLGPSLVNLRRIRYLVQEKSPKKRRKKMKGNLSVVLHVMILILVLDIYTPEILV